MKFGPNDPPSVKAGKGPGDEIPQLAVWGSILIAGPQHSGMRLFELPSLKPIRKKHPHAAAIACSEGSLATITGGVIALRDREGQVVKQGKPSKSPFNSIAFSPDGTELVAGEYEKAIVYDAITLKERRRFEVFDRTVVRIAWSPDGKTIAAQCFDDVGIFDAKTGKKKAVLAGITSDKSYRGKGALVFMPDGRLIATIDAKTVGIWKGGKLQKKIPATYFTYAAAAHPDVIAIGNTIYSPRFQKIGKLPPDEMFSLAIAGDGNTIFAGAYEKLHAMRRGGVPVQPAAPISQMIAKPRKAKITDLDAIDWLAKAKVKKWPGPDHAGVAALLELIQSLENDVEEALRMAEKKPDRTYERIHDRATKNLADYDPDADWSEPPNAAAMMVANIAQLVASFRTLKWALPSDLETLLAWCGDGKWPAGFVRAPKKSAELLVL